MKSLNKRIEIVLPDGPKETNVSYAVAIQTMLNEAGYKNWADEDVVWEESGKIIVYRDQTYALVGLEEDSGESVERLAEDVISQGWEDTVAEYLIPWQGVVDGFQAHIRNSGDFFMGPAHIPSETLDEIARISQEVRGETVTVEKLKALKEMVKKTHKLCSRVLPDDPDESGRMEEALQLLSTMNYTTLPELIESAGTDAKDQ